MNASNVTPPEGGTDRMIRRMHGPCNRPVLNFRFCATLALLVEQLLTTFSLAVIGVLRLDPGGGQRGPEQKFCLRRSMGVTAG